MGHDEIRAAVLRRLELLDRAVMADPGMLLPLARTEINRLTDGWRLLLTVHQRDEGRCGSCPTGFRGRRWPCPVWKLAYEQLIGESLPHRKRTRPLRHLWQIGEGSPQPLCQLDQRPIAEGDRRPCPS